jgi:5-methylcytosine-specific restriction enzyme A
MATFLLTWNPKRWTWDDLPQVADEVAERGRVVRRWSCGNTMRIQSGDRVFLLRQGQEPRGIVASGYVLTQPYRAPHWDPTRETEGLYLDVEFDAVQDPETDAILTRERLDEPVFADVYWNTQSSGISIPPHVAEALEREWALVIGQEGPIRDETAAEAHKLYEGAARAVTLNVYERNPRARQLCIAHYGATCWICRFDFGREYGPAADGFIHVHHLRPIAELAEEYEVDPVADLRPVCPNCHAVLHRKSPPYTMEEVQEMRRSRK